MQATVRTSLTAVALCLAVAAQTFLVPSAKAQKALPDAAVPAAEKTAQGKTMDIQEVTSPGGIKAWLVESHANPLISIRFAFFGGAAQDAPSKDGQAYFVTSMMDEGAGDLDSTAFQERAEDLAMRLSLIHI